MKPFLMFLGIFILVVLLAGAVEAGQNGGAGDGRSDSVMSGAQSVVCHSVEESVLNPAKGESLSSSQDFGCDSATKSESSSFPGDETSPAKGESLSFSQDLGRGSSTESGSPPGPCDGTSPAIGGYGLNGVLGLSAPDPINRRGESAGANPPISPGTTGGQGQGMGKSADFEYGNGPDGDGFEGNGPDGNGPYMNGPERNGPEGSGKPGDPGSHVRWEYVISTSSSPIMAHASSPTANGSGNRRNIPRMPFPATHAPYGEVPYGHIPATPVSQTPAVETSAERCPKRKEKSAAVTGSAQFVGHDVASTVPESGIHDVNLWKFFLLFGFSRLNRKNVLKNKYRNSIYSHICDNPGTDIGAIADLLGINRQTARYHVRILASRGLVCEFQKHGATRYFQNNGIFCTFKKTLIHYLYSGTQGKILFLLVHRPGLSRQEVADTLGISGPSVTWHARRLMEDGIISAESQGTYTRYSLSENACRELLEDTSCSTMIQSVRVTRIADQFGR